MSINRNINRRSFIVGGTCAGVAAAGLAGSGLVGCTTKKEEEVKLTKSGLDPNDFKSDGVYTFNSGITKDKVSTASIPTELYTVTNSKGAELCVTNVGARIVSLMIPDKDGNLKNMVLGFSKLADYVDYEHNQNNFYGAIVGRFANRIGKGQFSIDGKQYQVDVNEGVNMLHGGRFGWHYQTFTVEAQDDNSIKLKLVSPDGDMGFPGEVTLYVTYTLSDDNVLGIYYEATSTAATVMNVSNHAYFDVSGNVNSSVKDDYLYIPAKQTTPIDKNTLTTGEIVDITANGPFDFFCDGKTSGNINKVYGKKIGRDLNAEDLQTVFGDNVSQSAKDALVAKATNAEGVQLAFGKGYDHNFCVMDATEAKAAGVDFDGKFKITNDGSAELANKARLSAKFYSELSGITMTITSSEPGIQFYDGFDLNSTLANTDGKKISQYGGIALEPQHYPDWPNHSNFEANYLRPGQTLKSKSEYIFTV